MTFANVVMCDGKLIYGEMNNTQEKANIDKPLVKMNRRRAFLQNYLVRNNASLSVKGK